MIRTEGEKLNVLVNPKELKMSFWFFAPIDLVFAEWEKILDNRDAGARRRATVRLAIAISAKSRIRLNLARQLLGRLWILSIRQAKKRLSP
jgi:hypothetical protein